MGRRPVEGDPLAVWLNGPGRAALDAITGRAMDVVGVIDRALIVRYVNWTAPGLTPDGVIGNSVLDLAPPDYRGIARETYLGVLSSGKAARFETMYKDSAGVLQWDVRVGPIRHDGQVIGLVTISSDVTEQRRADADRDRFFSLSLDLLAVVSPDGRFKRVNPAFGEALGYALAELTGREFLDFVHPDDRARTADTFEGQMNGTPVTDFENRYRRADGEYRVFSWRSIVDPITGDVYAVARDITDHRLIESQLRHAQKMEAVGKLAGGVAHDFNNLLLAVLANTELALECAPPSRELAEHLGEIQSAAHRAADLTKQLLTFSRRQPLRPVPVDLNALLQSLMKMLRRLLPESITISLIPDERLASVDADPGQLEQVIVNLCVNARDAMESGGQLTISTENVALGAAECESRPWARPGSYVRLTVADTGAGMTADVRERAFEPFFTTKGPQQGTGLGLSTVYGIVQQHDGLLHLRSQPGEGTTFEIYLPEGARRAAPSAGEITAPAPRGRETILLAEDEDHVRRAVLRILGGAGYRTLAAANGLEAVRLLRDQTEPVHLALLDLVMPEQGGPETWEQLRALRPDLRVLFASGYADQRHRDRLPADADVIEKPFRAAELLRLIRAKLDGSAT